MTATKHSAQTRGGRRGFNFTVRLTREERDALEKLHADDSGPRAFGPWMVWAVLRARGTAPVAGTASTALPDSMRALPPRSPPLPRQAPLPGLSLDAPEKLPPVGERIILDLCAGSGAWSEPYKLSGYDVRRITLPDIDVRQWVPPSVRVWGVLAAPPCDQFSLARNASDTPRDIRGGLEIVSACLRIIVATRPRWWALENPMGLLQSYLGEPDDDWEPHEFGDAWTKRTRLWGNFTRPVRGPFVEPLSGMPGSTAAERAITPPGFARAFFEANK